MVDGALMALRCGNAPAGTLAISWQQGWQADDHPPAEPPIPRGGRRGRDQEERDAACAAPQLRDPPARARHRYQNHPGPAWNCHILPTNTRLKVGSTTGSIPDAARPC